MSIDDRRFWGLFCLFMEVFVEATEGQATSASSQEGHGMTGPLVFISHDSRDATLAEAFSKLLASVSAGMLKSFRSSDKKGTQGIEYGFEWYPELMKRLQDSRNVVCLLTETSINRPWILYEAGVAKGKLDTIVHGLALGISLKKASVGPFAQFQNCDGSVESITKLVVQLIKCIPNADPDQDAVKSQVEVFTARVAEVTPAPSVPHGEGGVGEESTSKLFEEIKVMFQDLPSRLENVAFRSSRGSLPRQREMRIHPEMLLETIQMVSRGEPRPGIAALILGSLFRDEVPWLHEMGVEVYRAFLAEDVLAERRSFATFSRATEMLSMGPFGREFGMTKDMHMTLHQLPMLLERYARDMDIASPEVK